MANPIARLAGRLFGPVAGAPVAAPQIVKPTQEIGVSGTAIFGGYIQPNERNPKLFGQNRYRITSDIFVNTSIVAAGVRYFLDLVAKPKWTVEPAGDGTEGSNFTAQAKEAAEFAESVLYGTSTSWSRIVRKSAEYRFHGFGIQEWTAKRLDSGQIGFASIEARPQHTIWRWDVDEKGTVNGVFQRNPLNGQEILIPRQKTVYLVDDTMTDSPEGVGMLRHLVEPAERLREYLRLEGVGFETDLRGIPIGRAPLGELRDRLVAQNVSEADIEKSMDAYQAVLIDFINNHIRSKSTGLILDSDPFRDKGDDQTPSAVQKWGLDLLQGSSNAFADIGTAINRLNHEMAVILGVENMLLGSGGQSGGSRALSSDKSEHMYLVVNSALGDIAEAMQRDLIGPLWMLNGFDDALRPKLKPEDVQFKDVGEITSALQQMAQAGAVLGPDDPAIDDVRSILGISPAPKADPATLGITPRGPAPGDDGQDDDAALKGFLDRAATKKRRR